MARSPARVESLPLRAAYARRRHWDECLAAAQASGDDDEARIAARFVAEYEDLIAELESAAKG